jgi:hypothetical protein
MLAKLVGMNQGSSPIHQVPDFHMSKLGCSTQQLDEAKLLHAPMYGNRLDRGAKYISLQWYPNLETEVG